jgi:hypothetical protein
MTLQVGKVTIGLKRGVCALLSKNGQIIKVRNLHENASGSLRIFVDRKDFVTVGAGQEAIIARSEQALSKAIDKDHIGRRLSRSVQLPAGMKMVKSEISLVSLMRRSGTIATMMHSDDYLDRKIAQRVVKMAACLMYATGAHGVYSCSP